MGEVFKLNHCYNVDCVPAMELFPDNYFDLAVVDPPYFSGPERRGFYGSKVSKIGVHRDYRPDFISVLQQGKAAFLNETAFWVSHHE